MLQTLHKMSLHFTLFFLVLIVLAGFFQAPPVAVAEPVVSASTTAYGYFYPHATAPGFGVGDSNAAALGDVDGDGDLDAVLAKIGAEEVWLNDGTGVFTPHPTAPTFGAADSRALAMADLDFDGDPDALFANDDAPDGLWLNDGSGVFTLAAELGLGHATDVAVADLDGDGDLDAVFANDQDQPETVWLNDGGSFNLTGSFGAGDSVAIDLGDIDGDGDIDAVVGNQLDQLETSWLNDGSGNFSLLREFGNQGLNNNGITNDLSLLDSDQDGDLDLFLAESLLLSRIYGFLTIWRNDGSGNFSRITSYTGGPIYIEIELGDVDNDGDHDLLITNGGDYGVSVWENVGWLDPDGYQRLPAMRSTGVALGDLDGDGDLDGLISTDASSGPPERVWLNDKPRCTDAEDYSRRKPVSDANLAIRDSYAERIEPSENLVSRPNALAADGAGSFYPQPDSSTFNTPATTDISLGDLDSDGDVDAITAEDHEAERVLLNDGSGVFTSVQTFQAGNTCEIDLGDLDGDGDLDALASNFMEPGEVWLNDGTGTFSFLAPIDTSNTSAAGATLGDLDGDGDIDVIFRTLRNDPDPVWLNDGSGYFSPHPSNAVLNNTQAITNEIVLSDFDGDADLDAAVAGWRWNTELYLNDGNGIFTLSTGLNAEYRDNRDMDAVDIDGDEDQDLMMCSQAPNDENDIFINDGLGNFSSEYPADNEGECTAQSLGDLDGDGDFDRLTGWQPYASSALGARVFLNQGAGDMVEWSAIAVGTVSDIELGDLDGDGDLDAVLLNHEAQPAVWLNTRPTYLTSIERLDPNPTTSAATARFGVHFNLPVQGVSVDSFSVTNPGAAVTEVSGSGADYIFSVSTGTNGGELRLLLRDSNGIVGPEGQGLLQIAFSWESYTVIDITPPSVTINQASGQLDPTGVQPVLFTAVFSEFPNGFAAADVILGGTSGPTTVKVGLVSNLNGSIWWIEVSGMSTNGNVTANIPAGVVTDGAGNANLASTSTDNSVEYLVSLPPVAAADSAATNEDTPVVIPVLANDSDPGGYTLAIQSVTDPAHGSVVIDDNGTSEYSGDDFVRYLPDANFQGADAFNYTVRNQLGQSVAASAQVSVQPVNDAPWFVPGPDVVVEMGAGEYSALWAWGMMAGPVDEAGQALSFEVVENSNPDLFTLQPVISPAGRLQFTPAAGVFGRAQVTISLRDDGGTQYGGVDVSPEYTFMIQIGPDWLLYLPIIQ